MGFSVSEKSDHKTLLMLIIASGVTLLMLTQASASFISNDYYLYAYAASKNKNDTSTEDTSTDDTTPSASVGSKTFLTVTTKVSGGTSKPSDFTVSVSGKNPSPKSFSGSSSGTSVTLNAGKYEVTASGPSDYTTSYSSGCSGTASGGTPIKCTVSNEYTGAPPGSTTFLNVITNVDNSNGGNKKPSDFTISVSGNSPSPKSFSGSSNGTSVTLKAGSYQVTEENDGTLGYSVSYSSGCSGTANGGVPIKCTITNEYTASLPGSTTFLDVITNVINNDQGTKKPSDFTITVTGNDPSPSSFSGSSSGTSVTLKAGSYKASVTERPSGYTTSYFSGCSGTAKGGRIQCTITNEFRPTPTTANLVVTKNVINNGIGTKKPSDFTITVKGNDPSPSSFSGSSSGTSVTLRPGNYKVTETNRPSGYATGYSSDCSDRLDAGQTKYCTIRNEAKESPEPKPLVTTAEAQTTTPIKHLVVIFQENVAFDHYFATYPKAANPDGEPHFSSSAHTPSINNLTTAGLLVNNTNLANPFRLDRSQAITVASCDPSHKYTAIQKSFNGGLMDKFVENSGLSSQENCDPKLVMGYFDGNTVTALWNYAQHYAMSDNFYSSVSGPSFPGHLNLVSGQTHGATPTNITGYVANGTVIGDILSIYDDCSVGTKMISMSGKNIGDLMNDNGISWGWFQGGFKPSGNSADNKAVCGTAHMNIAGKNITDYVVHHEPFQYYKLTANPHHLPPTSAAMIGKTDQANHQYDLSDFWNAANIGDMPAVSFLKASQYQTGHPGDSDPIDEQIFLVDTINHLQRLPQWNSTAIIITYDDSGGWYDHVMPPIISQSNDPKYDSLLGNTGLCGHAPSVSYQDRCGYGARLPMLIISPYSKVNYLDHSIIDQSSILRFIEDNWYLGRIGNQSFDAKAGSITNMFDFSSSNSGYRANNNHLFLNPTSGLQIQNSAVQEKAK
jgi:phospholipase C